MSNSGSCIVCPLTRNSKGEVVDSLLFKQLSAYLPSREDVIMYYRIAKSPEFIAERGDELQFDDNHEIKLLSLIKTLDINVDKDKTLKALNKEIGAKIYDYQEAVNRLAVFNREHALRDKYLATIEQLDNGEYRLSVVEKTDAEERKLIKTISRQTILNKLIYTLAQYGVGVEFLQEGNRSRYSTENAFKNQDGLYYLIQIAQGEAVNEDMAEEAGHFAVGALGNSPLVKRLLNLVTPVDVQQLILGLDYYTKVMYNNPSREVAGYLVGKALLGRLEGTTPIRSLVSRIVNRVKLIFYSFKTDYARVSQLLAERLAERIALGLLSPNSSMAELETALETKETLFSASGNLNIKNFKLVCAEMQKTISSLRGMNSSLNDRYQLVLEQILSASGNVDSLLDEAADAAAINGITVALSLVLDILNNEVRRNLEMVNFDNPYTFSLNMKDYGYLLREAHLALYNATKINHFVEAFKKGINRDTYGTYTDSSGIQHSANINELLDKLIAHLLRGTESLYLDLLKKEIDYWVKFLKDAYGSDYVEMAGGIVFNKSAIYNISALFKIKKKDIKNRADKILKNADKCLSEADKQAIKARFEKNLENLELNLKNRNSNKGLIYKTETTKIAIEDIASMLSEDMSYFDRFLGSASNSSDVATLIADKANKAARKWADDATLDIYDELLVLKDKFDKIKDTNIEKFYERDKNGNLTGNLIDINGIGWGEWEANKEGWELSVKQEFYEAHSTGHGTFDYDGLSDFQKNILWDEFRKPKMKEFHKKFSVRNKETFRWEPDPNLFINNQFGQLSKEELEWYKKYLNLKHRLDFVIDGHMPKHRAPLFEGEIVDRVNNRKGWSKLKPFWDNIVRAFVTHSEDWEYGSYMTYNNFEEDMFPNSYINAKECANRLPLFGINKVKDMLNLSTDLFKTTLMYASMAYRYATLGSVVDALEVGKNALSLREIVGPLDALRSDIGLEGNKSRVFNRYIKFLDKQVYGVTTNPVVIGNVNINKVARLGTKAAAIAFLGGNIAGGAINTGTGFIELLKEATAGEHYHLSTFIRAHKLYLWDAPRTWGRASDSRKTNTKLSLYVDKYNTLNANTLKFRNWNHGGQKVLEYLTGDLVMAPYTSGDHYMLTMAYLSVALETKLYDINGNITNLYDANEVTNVVTYDDLGNPTTHKRHTLKMLKEYFKNTEDIEQYKKYLELQELLLQQIDGNTELVYNDPKNPIDASKIKKGLTLLTTELTALILKLIEEWNPSSYNTNLSEEEQIKFLKHFKSYIDVKKDKLKWNIDDDSAYMDKCREINNRMHGVYNDMDKTALHLTFYGELLLAMRGWAVGGWLRVFGTRKYSVALGHDVEGYEITAFKAAALYASEIWNDKGNRLSLFWLALSTLLPGVGVFRNKDVVNNELSNLGFSDNQIANLRRHRNGWFIFLMLYILRALSKVWSDEDEDEEIAELALLKEDQEEYLKEYKLNYGEDAAKLLKEELNNLYTQKKKEKHIYMSGLFYYLFARLSRELGAWMITSPGYMIDEGSAVTSLIPAGLSLAIQLAEIGNNMLGAARHDNPVDNTDYKELERLYGKEYADAQRQENKVKLLNDSGSKYYYQREGTDYEKGDAKWKALLKRLIPYWKNARVLYNGREAAASYDYGRQMRN